MNLEHWQRIDELFQAVVELDPEQRAAFLEEACAGDHELRTDVESMLASDSDEREFLEKPVLEVAADLLVDYQPQLARGESIGHYRIVDAIGRGGMGEVYLAQDERLGRNVAIKLLPNDFTNDPSRVRRFQQEARAASALNHPNILTIHEIGQLDAQYFIASEFIEGETLRQRMSREGITLEEALNITTQVASALSVAHAAGIVHRDIKPENIMLRPDGYVKVLDFGLAKLAGHLGGVQEPTTAGGADDSSNISSGFVMGTVKYMSPEQAQGLEVDSRTDIFSTVVVLYEMIAGRPPFEGETNADLVAAILRGEPDPLSQHSPDIPAELQDIVTRALSKGTAERYQTARELIGDIERLREELKEGRKRQSRAERFLGNVRRRKAAGVGVTVAFALIALGGWWTMTRYFSSRGAVPFQERDWVLITSFENRTGDPVFDGSIEYAIERELSNSTFVNVIPRERTNDALQLMKKPMDTKIDAAVGKEICLRDGGIRAMLAGRTETLGSTYVFSMSLINPATSRSVASTSEEAPTQGEIAPAVRRLSNWVRRELGEALKSIRQSNQQLERVTTPSLRALQLYSQAYALMADQRWPVVEQLLREALVDDPDFATAHIMLAWAIRNQKGGIEQRGDEWRASSERARELSDRVSERERYFILGSYYHQRDEYEKAGSAYEALLELYPDDYWSLNNISNIYPRTGRGKEFAAHYFEERARLAPNSCNAQFSAAYFLAENLQFSDAQPYIRRVRELVSEGAKIHPARVAWCQNFLSIESYSRGDLETALKEADRLAEFLNGAEPGSGFLLAAFSYLRLGKLRAAEEIGQKDAPTELDWFMASLASIRSDQRGLRKHLLAVLDRNERTGVSSDMLVPLLTRAGLVDQASKIVQTSKEPETVIKVLQGHIALARGHVEQAISLLQPQIDSQERENATGRIILRLSSWDSLARAYEQRGDTANLLRTLEAATRENPQEQHLVQPTPIGFWQRMALHLAQQYRKMGRTGDAEKLEAQLLRLLTYADEDHPILVQLRRAQSR